MKRHEAYMIQKLEEERFFPDEDENEQAGKMAYGNVDMVNSPPHYNSSGIECVDAIQAATLDGFEYYLQGNILKYLWRYRYKNGIEDLNKAKWYLDKLISIQGETK